ncbi:MAG TPA: hypothetical protein VMH27_11570 [Puia sp.]|nr:hypothetical protein [Puia sp.]
MLKSISWSQFGLFLLLGAIVYYGWVAIRYYGRELRGFANRKATEKDPAEGAQSADAADTAQPTLFKEASADESAPELFKVMEKVITKLKSLVGEMTGKGIQRQELLDRLKAALAGYHHLKRTPYQVAINNYIERTCRTNFSLPLSEVDLEELWK